MANGLLQKSFCDLAHHYTVLASLRKTSAIYCQTVNSGVSQRCTIL